MKKVTLIVNVLFFLFNRLPNQSNKSKLEKYRAKVLVEEQNQTLVKQVFERLNKQDGTVYTDLYSTDYGWYFPANSTKKISREEEAGFANCYGLHFRISSGVLRK